MLSSPYAKQSPIHLTMLERVQYPVPREMVMPLVSLIAVAMALFHLYTGGMGTFTALIQRGVHLSFALVLMFLTIPGIKNQKNAENLHVIDIMWAILAVLPGAYFSLYFNDIAERGGMATDFEIYLGWVTIVMLLEAVRRGVGLPLFCIGIVAILYVYFGPYLPGMLEHRGYNLTRISYQMFMSDSGIMGTPLGVSATIIALFILFGSFLEQSGGAKYFIDLSESLTGRMRGGPAKAAVLASGLMGTVSGSAVANVVTTGHLTIPLMIRAGYSKVFAGAVEAVASSGGQLAPPIMGAAAFLMADMTGIRYSNIALGAVIPAVLFYGSLFIVVHLEACRRDLQCNVDGIGKIENRAHMFIPLVLLIILLSLEYSPTYVGFWTIVGMVAISWMKPSTRLTPKKVYAALETGALGILPVTAACASAGIVVGAVTLTGLPIKFSTLLIEASGGSLSILLILTMFTSLILGMGLPTAPAYILLATLIGPALTGLGVNVLAAHMFIFFFGVVSAITPPVALAAFAAAGISGAKPNETGFKACWIGIITFIVPYMFVYEPALVGEGSFTSIVIAFTLACIGVCALGVALTGYFVRVCNPIIRLLVGAGAAMVLHPEVMSSLAGIVLLVVVLSVHVYVLGKKTANTATS